MLFSTHDRYIVEKCIRYAEPAVGLISFQNYIWHSPRRRALPRLAEGFSPTARGRIPV